MTFSLLLFSYYYTYFVFVFPLLYWYYSTWFMCVFCYRKGGKVKVSCSFFAGLCCATGRGRVNERDGRHKLFLAASAINIRNLFKFNFDFICFLSGAAAVFTFIRFGSFWFCSFASENSKHPAKLATSLLADLSGLLGLASWLAGWLTARLPRLLWLLAPARRQRETSKHTNWKRKWKCFKKATKSKKKIKKKKNAKEKIQQQ